ncbi:MAG: DEAD/DEAH box helicase family protein [Thermoplasmata archaeon]|nr:DEAD/DEAH box helicase family protein [Thermoplasmata archaeon]
MKKRDCNAVISEEFVEMENLKKNSIVSREYQINIFNAIKNRNSMVVLPTGLGKTMIAAMMVAYHVGRGKILFLAPTKPLCEQHYETLKRVLTVDEIYLVTGEKTRKKQRLEIYKKARIIVATPQTIENDMENIDFSLFRLAIFDECHRCVGNYAYVPIARKCIEHGVITLGLTASPGSNHSRLKEVVENLGIEHIEVRNEYDRDVKPYIPERKMRWILIDMPHDIKAISMAIDAIIEDFLQELKKYIKFSSSPRRVTKKMLIELQGKLQVKAKGGGSVYGAISIVSALIKIYHLKEMLTSQGVEAAINYMDKIDSDTSKGGKRIRANPRYRKVREAILSLEYRNPKLDVTRKILASHFSSRKDARVMIFAEYRDTIDAIYGEISRMEGIRAAKFVGQAKGSDGGMSQDEQKKVIEDFRKGVYNVLISTSIGEEGIDIPATSMVLFYEPVPSAIRYIQRRGRTARGGMPGEVYILIMRGSRDEAYYWSSRRKEKKMMEQIKRLRGMIEKVAKEERRGGKETGKKKEGQAKLDLWMR